MKRKKEKVQYGEMSLSERWAACAIGMGTGLLPYMINGYISFFYRCHADSGKFSGHIYVSGQNL